jgi:hypothetical protein
MAGRRKRRLHLEKRVMMKNIKLTSKLDLSAILALKKTHMIDGLQCSHEIIRGLMLDLDIGCYLGFSRPVHITKDTFETVTGVRIILSQIGTRIVDIYGETHTVEHAP